MKKLIIIPVLFITFLIALNALLSYLNSGFLTVKTTPKDAAVILNEKKGLKEPAKKLRLKKGEHTLAITKEGYLSENISFELKRKENKTLNVKLLKDISESLPENNDQFQVELIDDSYYEVTLYPILNRPDQVDEYDAQLKEFKKIALDWLKEKGIDTSNKEKIKFIPEEAQNL